MDRQQAAEGFALLADPNRLLILRLLAREETSAAQLLQSLPVSQPTLSHHMKLLCEGGLVTRRRQGQKMFYRLARQALAALLDFPLEEIPPEKPAAPAFQPPAVIIRSGHR